MISEISEFEEADDADEFATDCLLIAEFFFRGLDWIFCKLAIVGLSKDDNCFVFFKRLMGEIYEFEDSDAGDKGSYVVDPLPFPALIIGGTVICSKIFRGNVVCPFAGEFWVFSLPPSETERNSSDPVDDDIFVELREETCYTQFHIQFWIRKFRQNL